MHQLMTKLLCLTLACATMVTTSHGEGEPMSNREERPHWPIWVYYVGTLGAVVLLATAYMLTWRRFGVAALVVLVASILVMIAWMIEGLRWHRRQARRAEEQARLAQEQARAAERAAQLQREAQAAGRRAAQQVNARRTVSHGGMSITVHRAPSHAVEDKAKQGE